MTVLASGILLYRLTSEGPRLLLLRNRSDGHWGLPKGRRDEGDAHEIATALREVGEETGFGDLELAGDFRRVVEYRVRGSEDDGREKRVVYFLARAPAGEVALSPEHDAFRWADLDETQHLLTYEQLRGLAREVLGRLDGPRP